MRGAGSSGFCSLPSSSCGEKQNACREAERVQDCFNLANGKTKNKLLARRDTREVPVPDEVEQDREDEKNPPQPHQSLPLLCHGEHHEKKEGQVPGDRDSD